MRPPPSLDVVIPCYNEEEVLPESCRAVRDVLSSMVDAGQIRDWRMILVDNSSTDRTFEVMRELFDRDPRVLAISLRRNFGFQGSLSAGLAHSSGDAVVSIDADLQDPPELISEMVARYRDGFDLVLAVRANRREADSVLVRLLASAYYRLGRLLGTPTVPQHGDFRLMSRSLVDVVNRLPERNRFLRTMISQIESRYATVPYSRRPRRHGRSKHGIATTLSIALDGVVGFGYQPLRILLAFGAIGMACTLALALAIAVMSLGREPLDGLTWLLVGIAFTASLNMLALGLIGEYLGRVFVEVKGRPVFLVREMLERTDISAQTNHSKTQNDT